MGHPMGAVMVNMSLCHPQGNDSGQSADGRFTRAY